MGADKVAKRVREGIEGGTNSTGYCVNPRKTSLSIHPMFRYCPVPVAKECVCLKDAIVGWTVWKTSEFRVGRFRFAGDSGLKAQKM